jgi:hypothetical protein
MATYSSNVTQKIGGGAAFNLTSNGDILTTASNEIAKINVRGWVQNTGGLFYLSIGATIIAGGNFQNAGNWSLDEDSAINLNSAFYGAKSFNFTIPPNSTLALFSTNVVNMSVKGTYQKFLNTP